MSRPNMMRGLRGSNFYTYFKTINEINLAQVTSQIDARLSETMRVKVNTIMQPLTSIHLTPNLLGEMKPSGDKRLLLVTYNYRIVITHDHSS